MEITWKPRTAGILTIIAGCLGTGGGLWLWGQNSVSTQDAIVDGKD
ncbi:MAG: hypothetical protein V3V43_02210 [Dehalococcoidales bacterium]